MVMSMTFTRSYTEFATRRRGLMLRAALLTAILFVLSLNCVAQTDSATATPVKPPVEKPAADTKPLTADERAELLKLIRSLQERVDKLEAAQAGTEKSSSTTVAPADAPAQLPAPADGTPNSEAPAPAEAKPKGQDDDDKFDG